MKSTFLAAALAALAAAPAARAAPEERPGRLKLPDDFTLELRARLQPRLDLGEIARSRSGDAYAQAHDLYLRRVRIGLEGRLLRAVRYGVTFEADGLGQDGSNPDAALHEAWASYGFGDALEVVVGKTKLPYSRSALTSSGALLFPDRPFSVEAAKDVFDAYLPVNVRLQGEVAGGVLAWRAAAGDGWERNVALDAAGGSQLVRRSDPLVALRVELSPPGWVEKRRRGSHLGEGRHLALGASVAGQRNIAYQASGASEDRTLVEVDLSGHAGPFTAQAEVNGWNVDSNAPGRRTVRPRGFYAQAAWLLGSVEPAIRWERFEEDAAVDGALLRAFTLGANWYLRRHDLKLQAAWVHVRRGSASPGRPALDGVQNLLQVQAQLDL